MKVIIKYERIFLPASVLTPRVLIQHCVTALRGMVDHHGDETCVYCTV